MVLYLRTVIANKYMVKCDRMLELTWNKEEKHENQINVNQPCCHVFWYNDQCRYLGIIPVFVFDLREERNRGGQMALPVHFSG